MGFVWLGILFFILVVYGVWVGMLKEEDDDIECLFSKCEGI